MQALSTQLRAPVQFRGASATPRVSARAPLRVVARAAPRGKAPVKRAPVVEEEPENNLADVGATVMRVATGVFMIHNGLDKLSDPEGFAKFVVEPYLHLPFPVQATYLAAYSQLLGSAGLIFGFQTRAAAAAVGGTMLGAVAFHLASSGLEGFPLAVVKNHQYAFETAVLYGLISLYFLLAGGGPFSVDAVLAGKKEDDE